MIDLARAQIARGHDVGIFCDSRTGGARTDAILAELEPHLAMGLTRVPMWRNPHPGDVTAMAALARLRRRTQPDVLHGHGSKGGVFARLSVSSHGTGAIRAYTPHGGSFNYKPGTLIHRLYMSAERMLERRTDVFLFESAFVAQRFETYVGATNKAVRIIHNGISEEEFEPIEFVPEPLDLVYLGELRSAKGIDTLIDALAMLRRQNGMRLTLLVVGSGPSQEELQTQVRDLGLADCVSFAPPQPIRNALAQGRVMVIPSRAESLPYVILEAAAAAQPLVATDVGGIPEIFGPYARDLIPPGDPAILARAILAKLHEPEAERRAKAESLSRFVRTRFSLDQMVSGVLDGYESAFAAQGMKRVAAIA